MWKTIATIFLGRQARAKQQLETNNASLILEQKLREAEAGHGQAKRALASLIARSKTERKTVTALEGKITDLEQRIKQALKAEKQSLAEDAATLLADLENEYIARTQTLQRAEEKADRLRLAIEKTQRRLVDLRQGLITAKAIEQERSAMKNIRGDLSANAAITEGENVLKRLLESEDPVVQMDALEEVEADLSGDGIIDRLADAGFGKSLKIRTEDILARLSETIDKEGPNKAPASI